MIDEGHDEAKLQALDDDALLGWLGGLTSQVASTKSSLEGMYDLQTKIFAILRSRGVTNRRIAEAAQISEEAVIQRLRSRRAKAAS